MRGYVYVLIEEGSGDILAVSASMAGAGTFALGEGRELILEDRTPFTLDGLETRLGSEAHAWLFTPLQEAPVLRVERHFVGP